MMKLSSEPIHSKEAVRTYWERQSCGEVYADGRSERERLDEQARLRYLLEPYIESFAKFDEGRDRDVLEVGVGMGADFERWARSSPRSLTGLDLTQRAVEFARARLEQKGLAARLEVGDAESLPFPDDRFDIVYSWGVLHHSPNTPAAAREVRRVLRPGGVARVMMYHTDSLVGYMLWARYGLLAGRPRRTLREIYAEHLESPGTKAYSVDEAREMFRGFSSIRVRSQLSFGDLLEGAAGQRHRGLILGAAKALWPRRFIQSALADRGLFLLIEARK